MKLSLSWIFDHIQGSWKEHDIPALIDRMSITTVEIDDWQYHAWNLEEFTVATFIASQGANSTVMSPELKQELIVAKRDDAQPGSCYMLKKDAKGWRWATHADFGGAKDTLLPRFFVADAALQGAWKNSIAVEDYVITIDNVVITHRPDLWSHRGFAREIAALLKIPLKPLEKLVEHIPVQQYENTASVAPQHAFAVTIKDENACRRIAACSFDYLNDEGSIAWIAQRLAMVDGKALNAIVDATNYVMFDIGQPLHAFDAHAMAAKDLIVTRAKAGQSLKLLDDQEITLTADDLVISDGKSPVALAGIMGGKATAVTDATDAIIVEAACYAPQIIRKTSTHYKLRTEASTRFEKNLDPHLPVIALQRYAKLLKHELVLEKAPTIIVDVGRPVAPRLITLTHAAIEKKLGISLKQEQIIKILEALEFIVTVDASHTYTVTVPTFRATKDVQLAEDVIEEVGRFVGFSSIEHKVPALARKPSDLTVYTRTHALKNYLAFGAAMHEVRNYAVYDEDFLRLIQYEPEETISIINPVSTTMRRMVTSLVPALLKNIETNAVHRDTLNFFEMNTIFSKVSQKKVEEQQSAAGIFYDAKKQIDFYQYKACINALLKELHFACTWHKAEGILAPWYHPYQTAYIMHGDKRIGIAGIANPALLHRVKPGSAFIFELDAQFLLHAPADALHFTPLAKYQDTWADISMLVPVSLTADQVMATIKAADTHIFNVEIVDFFQKEEWHDQRSLTIRYYARAADKTLSGPEIDAIHAKAVRNVGALGATIR